MADGNKERALLLMTNHVKAANAIYKNTGFADASKPEGMKALTYCCGATEGSEQQHNQDLNAIYEVRPILKFITFYHNPLHLTTPFTTMHCI